MSSGCRPLCPVLLRLAVVSWRQDGRQGRRLDRGSQNHRSGQAAQRRANPCAGTCELREPMPRTRLPLLEGLVARAILVTHRADRHGVPACGVRRGHTWGMGLNLLNPPVSQVCFSGCALVGSRVDRSRIAACHAMRSLDFGMARHDQIGYSISCDCAVPKQPKYLYTFLCRCAGWKAWQGRARKRWDELSGNRGMCTSLGLAFTWSTRCLLDCPSLPA